MSVWIEAIVCVVAVAVAAVVALCVVLVLVSRSSAKEEGGVRGATRRR